MNIYLEAKEYVDTLLLPLIAIDWEGDPKHSLLISEYVLAISAAIEKYFTGRVFQVPAFTYVLDEGEEKITRLLAWEKYFHTNGFKHLIYVTGDDNWKHGQNQSEHLFICLPEMGLEDLDEKGRNDSFGIFVQESISLIKDKWERGD